MPLTTYYVTLCSNCLNSWSYNLTLSSYIELIKQSDYLKYFDVLNNFINKPS